MSISFRIDNPKSWFGKKAVLSLNECLCLVAGLSQYSYSEFDNDIDLDKRYNSPLTSERVIVGIDELAGRGFEIGFDEGAYHVRINTPAAIEDWQAALQWLSALSQKLDKPIICEDDQKFSRESIMTYDYKSDIESGLYSIQGMMAEAEMVEIMGIHHPMAFNQQMIQAILSSSNPSQAFSQALLTNQSVQAYFANQMIAHNDYEDIGVYVLGEDVATILPIKPSVNMWSEYDDAMIDGWYIHLVFNDGTMSERLEYDKVIAALNENDYVPLDAKYIQTIGFDQARLQLLLSKVLQA
ncbi:MAG: DUF4299 family protein [Moraxella sp.]|nr:DUF4299 family protein [Moraxella sp.]